MERVERRMKLLRGRRECAFDLGQIDVESAARGRAARCVRGHVRRLDAVTLLTPRWSAPQGFLEDIALDLAVGQPEIGCRTVSFRPLRGRSAPEAWNFVLRVLAELPAQDQGTRPVPMVCDRRGFFHAAERLLESAHELGESPVALLTHGSEHLPVEVLDDLAQVWSRYLGQARNERRCTILIAGSVETPALEVDDARRVDLCDFGEAEAAATLLMRLGMVPGPLLERAVRFSGGVPAIVLALAEGSMARGGLPPQAGDLLRCLGPVGDELRGAVEMALAVPESAERLHALLDGGSRREEPEVDRPLLLAGLLRRTRSPGPSQVALRSPALAVVSA